MDNDYITNNIWKVICLMNIIINNMQYAAKFYEFLAD